MAEVHATASYTSNDFASITDHHQYMFLHTAFFQLRLDSHCGLHGRYYRRDAPENLFPYFFVCVGMNRHNCLPQRDCLFAPNTITCPQPESSSTRNLMGNRCRAQHTRRPQRQMEIPKLTPLQLHPPSSLSHKSAFWGRSSNATSQPDLFTTPAVSYARYVILMKWPCDILLKARVRLVRCASHTSFFFLRHVT